MSRTQRKPEVNSQKCLSLVSHKVLIQLLSCMNTWLSTVVDLCKQRCILLNWSADGVVSRPIGWYGAEKVELFYNISKINAVH